MPIANCKIENNHSQPVFSPNPHSAIRILQLKVVELRRLELLTYSLQSYRSTN